jgi:hypothetical protein
MSEEIQGVSNPMVGGDFLLATASTLSQSTIMALAAMSGISSFANYSSYQQLTSLTTEQVAALISSIEVLIASEQSTISRNQTTVSQLRAAIDMVPGGYRDVYNSTVNAYSTAVRIYYTTLDQQRSTENTISTMTQVLCSMMIEDAQDVSTINGLQEQYSTLMRQIQGNEDMLNSQISGYNSLSSIYGGYVRNYEQLLSSFAVETNPSTLLTISTNMAHYISLERQLSPYIQSTLITISSLSFYSTTYAGDISTYNTTYRYYSSLEQQTIADINRLIAERSTLSGRIGGYEMELWSLGQSSITEFGTLRGQAATFNTKKRTQIQNQLLAFKLSVQEWRSFIGYLVSQLTIHNTNLQGTINLLSFQIAQIGSTNPTMTSQLSSQQMAYTTEMNTIQGILTRLNSFESSSTPSFAGILAICETERVERDLFMDNRVRLTEIEIDVLQDPTKIASQVLKQEYNAKKTDMETVRVVNIDANMNLRWTAYANLLALINPELISINALGRLSYTRPYQQSRVNTPFYMNPSDFQILNFIQFV